MNYKIETIGELKKEHQGLCMGIARLTKPINDAYPRHNRWLFEKFFPGLKNNTRKIVVAYDDLANPIGVCLLKDDAKEKKICCLFVREDFRNQGIAARLMQAGCKALKTNTPLATVSDRNLPQLQELLDKHNFKFSYKKKNVYQKGDTENYFNNEATEILKEKILNPLFLRAKGNLK